MRSAPAILVAVAAAVVLALAAVAATSDREQAFTLGVSRSVALQLAPGREVCQSPVSVPPDAGFDAVTMAARSAGRRPVRLDVAVRATDAAAPARPGALLTRGALETGAAGGARTVRTGHVGAGRTVAVCVANRDRRPALLYGNADVATRTSSAYADGTPTGYDLALDFQRAKPRSLAALVPAMFERAALFRAQWVGAWLYWVAGLLCVLAVPLLLARALRSAASESSGA